MYFLIKNTFGVDFLYILCVCNQKWIYSSVCPCSCFFTMAWIWVSVQGSLKYQRWILAGWDSCCDEWLTDLHQNFTRFLWKFTPEVNVHPIKRMFKSTKHVILDLLPVPAQWHCTGRAVLLCSGDHLSRNVGVDVCWWRWEEVRLMTLCGLRGWIHLQALRGHWKENSYISNTSGTGEACNILFWM